MASLTYVGGTEIYTENIQVQHSVSMQNNSYTLTDDMQDDFWEDKYYYEGSSTALTDNFHLQFRNNTLEGMYFSSRHFTTDKIGTTITSKITFLKAFKNVKISKIYWRNNTNGVDTTTETCTIKLNEIEKYTISATKERYGESYPNVETDILIGDVSVGDVISFEDSKSGTISDTSAYRDLVNGLDFYFSSDPIIFTETVPVQKTRGVNKPVSSIYAGVTATVPVYTETTTTEDIALSTNTFTDFFSADNTGTTGTGAEGITWADNSGDGLKLAFGNYGIHSSTSMSTFTAQRDLTNVVIKGLYYTETNYDKITLTVAGTTVLDAVSGTSSTLTQRWTGSLSKGQTIVLKFVKDSSQSATNESSTYFTLSCDPYQKTETTKTQTGTETKLADKKIVKGYVGGPDGKARLFFESGGFSYTGEYTEYDYISSSGTKHKIYTLLTSGEMKSAQKASYWMCGGGAGGQSGYTYLSNECVTAGGGGGGGYIVSGNVEGTHSIIIGAGGTSDSNGGSTSCDEENALGGYCATGTQGSSGGNGGSGGGAPVHVAVSNYSWGHNNGGTGAGVSTYPFGVEALFAHCAGGSAGITKCKNSVGDGFAGGTNGGNGGGTSSSGIGRTGTPADGGEKGGGAGGRIPGYKESEAVINGGDATFFGSGAGGAGAYFYAAGSTSNKFGTGGIGYQGVAYIAIPPITTT